MKLLFIIINIIYLNISYSRTLYVFTPELPKIKEGFEVDDVFSTNLLIQTSSTLFIIDEFGNPKPNLVKNFDVLNKGKEYIFELQEVNLNSKDIKESIEYGIKKKSGRYRDFSTLIGYKNFPEESSYILGIELLTPKKIKFKFSQPNFNFLNTLSDFRFPIYKTKGGQFKTFGDYRVVENKKNRIVLESTNTNFFDRVVYTNKCKDTEFFISPFGRFDNCNRAKAEKVKFRASKTYMMHLNRDTLGFKMRKKFISSIKYKEIVSVCYPGNKVVKNIVPPGFAGYNAKINEPKLRLNNEEKTKMVKVAVANGIENIECVKKFFQQYSNVSVDVLNTDLIIKKWKNNKIDAIFWYIESEEGLEHINYFFPSNPFKLGPSKLKDFDLVEKTNVNYKKNMQIYSQVVLDSLVTVPLFRPDDWILKSKRVFIPKSFISSPTYLKFSKFSAY